MEKRIGIIGFGNMGSAIAERLKDKYPLLVFDKDNNRTRGLSGIKVAGDLGGLIREADALILAVKPQDFQDLLNQIKTLAGNKLIISIAAGIPTDYIEKYLGAGTRVIRVMPSIGVKTGDSVSALCKGRLASAGDLLFAKGIFDYLGVARVVAEAMMDAVTAVSGSGPAYVCNDVELKGKKEDFIKNFEEAAEAIGLNYEDACFFVNQTYTSTINILQKTKEKPEELRKQVTSKGGTTEAALRELKKGRSLKEAVQAAWKRAKELSRG